MVTIRTLVLLIATLLIQGCVSSYNDYYVEPVETQPATPASADTALKYITSDDMSKQIIGMWAILNYPESMEEAEPLIRDNLYDSFQDVRVNAARVLAKFGTSARSSAPDLVIVMNNDSSDSVRTEAAIALGSLGDKIVVPELAKNLYGASESLAVYSAKSISLLTGEPFPDAESSGYNSNADGKPYIVIAAQDWWEKVGQFVDWTK